MDNITKLPNMARGIFGLLNRILKLERQAFDLRRANKKLRYDAEQMIELIRLQEYQLEQLAPKRKAIDCLDEFRLMNLREAGI